MGAWDADEVGDVEQLMAERLSDLLAPGERLTVSGSSSPAEVVARFVLTGGAGGERLELEARVEPEKAGLDERTSRDLALDALDLLLLGWLEGGRQERFSGVFEERELRGKAVSVRAERTFASLEAQADALLRGDC